MLPTRARAHPPARAGKRLPNSDPISETGQDLDEDAPGLAVVAFGAHMDKPARRLEHEAHFRPGQRLSAPSITSAWPVMKADRGEAR